MKKLFIGIVAAFVIAALSPVSAFACEFCTMHNGLGQYNNLGDFVSVTYRSTTATTTVTGSTVQPATGAGLSIGTTQLYYQHSFGSNLKAALVLPMVNKTSTMNGATVDSSSGLGDVIALGRYTVMQDEDYFFAVQGGIKFATGAKKNALGTTTFSPDLGVGTGSTDPIAGFVYNRNMGNWNFSADALYKFSGVGYDGYQFGNVLNWGLNGYYRLNNNFNIGAGLVSEVMAADNDTTGTVSGAIGTVVNTGGSVIFAQPTIQYVNSNFYADLSYQVPVSRSFTGTQLVVDNKVILGVRYAF